MTRTLTSSALNALRGDWLLICRYVFVSKAYFWRFNAITFDVWEEKLNLGVDEKTKWGGWASGAKLRGKDEGGCRGNPVGKSETGDVQWPTWMVVNDFMETRLMGLSDYFHIGTVALPQFIIPAPWIMRLFLNLLRPAKPPALQLRGHIRRHLPARANARCGLLNPDEISMNVEHCCP